jgi:hypothetical protein
MPTALAEVVKEALTILTDIRTTPLGRTKRLVGKHDDRMT